jgi:hypothetical protein
LPFVQITDAKGNLDSVKLKMAMDESDAVATSYPNPIIIYLTLYITMTVDVFKLTGTTDLLFRNWAPLPLIILRAFRIMTDS